MSVVFVVVPVVAGSWPILSAAIVAAGAAMGYRALGGAEAAVDAALQEETRQEVDMVMEDSRVVTDTLMRGESFTMRRDDVTATFRVDGRGCCSVHVAGQGRSRAELIEAGNGLMDRVRQQFAYAKVMAEMEERGFQVVSQQVEADSTIRIRVRR